jgi:transposase-like protein
MTEVPCGKKRKNSVRLEFAKTCMPGRPPSAAAIRTVYPPRVPELLSVFAFPTHLRKKLRTTNAIERFLWTSPAG